MLTTSKLNKLVLPKAVQRASFADEDGAGVWRSCLQASWRVGRGPSSPSGARVVPWHCALTGVLTTSQISTFSSENKWKSRVLWEVWGRHRGGSSALQVSYCHSFFVYPWTLDKVKVKQSTFQLKFYLFLIWSFILFNKSSTHVPKKIRKITWTMKQVSLPFWNIHLLTSTQ